MQLALHSAAFEGGRPIPVEHTADGGDRSPDLSWSGAPWGTVELALIVDDPDAPTPQPWVHWVIYRIPATLSALPGGFHEGTIPPEVTAPGLQQGPNSWRTVGYRGPAPPRGHGRHHYRFRLYALDAALALPEGLDAPALRRAIAGHVLAEAELVGTYER